MFWVWEGTWTSQVHQWSGSVIQHLLPDLQRPLIWSGFGASEVSTGCGVSLEDNKWLGSGFFVDKVHSATEGQIWCPMA